MARPAVTCQYCDRPAAMYTADQEGYPYPEDWGPAWKCAPCDAYIRCYEGTHKPLGTLADAETREWRGKAHAAFDPLWADGTMSRSAAYRWLSHAIGIEDAHIGHMGPSDCQQVLELVRRL